MARIDSLSIDLRTTGKDKLAEEYGKVIENIQHITLASRLKNQDLSGDPTSGTVEAKRFVNASGKAYGTARSNGKGDYIKAEPVVIAINDDTEYAKTIGRCISGKADDIVLEELRKLIAANEREIKLIDKKYEKIFKRLESILNNPDISPEKKKEILAAVGYEDEIKPFIAKRQSLQENLFKREQAMKLTKKS
jgi:hypothetical protein